MPLSGSRNYSRNLYDVRPRDLDNLAEEQIARGDRYSQETNARLERGGIRTANELKEMGKTLADGVRGLPDTYRKGRSDNIALGQQGRENDWRQEIGGAVSEESAPQVRGEFVGPPRSAMNKQGPAYTNPSLEYLKGNTSTGQFIGAPDQVVSSGAPSMRLGPDVLASKGAAPVLDGKVKPGFNAGAFSPDTQNSRGLYNQSNLLNRPAEEASAPVIEDMGPLLDAPKKERPLDTNERRLWTAKLMQAEAQANNLAKGKLGSPFEQQKMDLEIKKYDLEREKAGKSKSGSEEGISKYQQGQLDLGNRKLEALIKQQEAAAAAKAAAPAKPAGGANPALDYRKDRDKELDAAKEESKRAAAELKANESLDKKTTSYSDKIGNIGDAVLNLNSIITKIPETGDIPGYGQTGMTPQFMLSDEGKALRQDLSRIFNVVLKERSGAAVTVPEFERLKTEFGTNSLATDKEFRYALTAAVAALKEKIRNINSGFDPAVIKQYIDREGRDFSTFDPKFSTPAQRETQGGGKKALEDMSDAELEAELKR